MFNIFRKKIYSFWIVSLSKGNYLFDTSLLKWLNSFNLNNKKELKLLDKTLKKIYWNGVLICLERERRSIYSFFIKKYPCFDFFKTDLVQNNLFISDFLLKTRNEIFVSNNYSYDYKINFSSYGKPFKSSVVKWGDKIVGSGKDSIFVQSELHISELAISCVLIDALDNYGDYSLTQQEEVYKIAIIFYDYFCGSSFNHRSDDQRLYLLSSIHYKSEKEEKARNIRKLESLLLLLNKESNLKAIKKRVL